MELAQFQNEDPKQFVQGAFSFLRVFNMFFFFFFFNMLDLVLNSFN